jgi:hypothetical protein
VAAARRIVSIVSIIVSNVFTQETLQGSYNVKASGRRARFAVVRGIGIGSGDREEGQWREESP